MLLDTGYDIEARVAPEDVAAWQQAQIGYDNELLPSAWRAVLKDCCKLALHLTPREVPYLDLIVGKNGAMLTATVAGATKPVIGKTSRLGKGFYIQHDADRQFVGVSMEDLALILTRLGKNDPPVQDKTGLSGRYDFTLTWYGYDNYPITEISDAIDRMPLNNIGLMLKSGKGPGFILNIDHIDKPDPK